MTVSDSNCFYVYLHLRKDNDSVFYVGKGKDRRAWSSSGRNSWWNNVAKKHGFYVVIYEAELTEQEALKLEIDLIKKYRETGILTNIVDGGGGTTGWKHSDETKAKISSFNKGKKLSEKALQTLREYNSNKKLTEEHKKKLSEAKKGKKRKPLSEETKRKIAQSHLGIRPSEESRKKMSESKIGKCFGKNHPTYDHKIYVFINDSGEIFEGTRGDFIKKYGLRDSCVSSLISGKRKSIKQWRKK